VWGLYIEARERDERKKKRVENEKKVSICLMYIDPCGYHI